MIADVSRRGCRDAQPFGIRLVQLADGAADLDGSVPVPLGNRIRLVTSGFFGVSGGPRVFLDQAAQGGFSADPFAVEVGDGDAGSVGSPSGTRWAMPWCGLAVL